MSTAGVIFNIQRYTIHDGPGVRTELFLKGCPLHCPWCSNPESARLYPQPGLYRTRCLGARRCGACTEVCRVEGALQFRRGKLTGIDRSRCINCMACAEACPAEALKVWGRSMTVEQCMEIIRRDKGFYDRSGGGVTVSGGEPMLQSGFVKALFEACQAEGIHTCCETTFFTDWRRVQPLLPVTDLFISDIKQMDDKLHRQYTGVSNERILANLTRLADLEKPLILRIPVIPGVNDDERNITATANFLLGPMRNRVRTLQLLSYMRLGEEKYQSLDQPYPMEGLRFNRRAFQKRVEQIAAYFNSRGIHCLVGTREKE
ncbi:MAG: glycyl-radical enzyme activating protein [Gemmiger sp.]